MSSGFASNQPAHPGSLINAFVIRLLESFISKLATSEILIFYLVSVAEQTGLSPTFSETLKTGFVASTPILNVPVHEIFNNVVCATSKASDQSEPLLVHVA